MKPHRTLSRALCRTGEFCPALLGVLPDLLRWRDATPARVPN